MPKNNAFHDSLLTKLRQWLVIGAPVIFTIGFSFVLQITVLANPELVSRSLTAVGPSFIVAYVIIQFLAVVIAPLGGAFVWIALIAVVGPLQAGILSYLVTTPAFFVNFYLAKRYGKNFLGRLIGKGGVDKVASIASDVGIEAAWILKIFQGGQFDYFSYALGLTEMSYRQFALVNIIGGIPSGLIYYFILTRFENFTLGIVALNLAAGGMVLVSMGLRHYHKKWEQSDLTP